jgi:hypothetical protein
MEALITQGYGPMSPEPAPGKTRATPETRTKRAATIFAAIWLALAVGSPLIVRYGPSTDDHAMAALVTRMEQPRCARAPEFGYPCPGRAVAARDARPDTQPDL